MRKPSKTVPRAEFDDVSRAADVAAIALSCVLLEQPDTIERFTEVADRQAKYEVRAYRLTAPHGGIVVQIYRFPQQRPQVRAFYLEAYDAAHIVGYAPHLPFRIAIEHIRAHQLRMLDNVEKVG